MPEAAPYSEYTTEIQPEWIDYNGHLNVAYYHKIFDYAARHFFKWLGLSAQLRKEHKLSTFALETHMNYFSEVKLENPVRVESRLLGVHPKRFHFFQEMYKIEGNVLSASHESLGTVMNMETRKTAAMPDYLYTRLQEVKATHDALPVPWQVGHSISINGKG